MKHFVREMRTPQIIWPSLGVLGTFRLARVRAAWEILKAGGISEVKAKGL